LGDTVTTGNELVKDGTYKYGYDNAGNEISKTDIATSDAWTYSYNNANELVSAVETNASSQVENSVTYEYDAMGDKIEATTVEYTCAGPNCDRICCQINAVWIPA
jgi:YD repeat-containing protein